MAVTATNAFTRAINDYYATTQSATLSAVNDVTPAVALSRNIAVAVTGPATDVEIVMQRSATNPADGARWVSAGISVTGNPATGIEVQSFLEPGVGWWRARVVSITGASVTVDITGTGAI